MDRPKRRSTSKLVKKVLKDNRHWSGYYRSQSCGKFVDNKGVHTGRPNLTIRPTLVLSRWAKIPANYCEKAILLNTKEV